MQKIKQKPIVNPFTGLPFEASLDVKRDGNGKVILEKNEMGVPSPVPIKVDLTTALAIRQFLAQGLAQGRCQSCGADSPPLTITDSHHALRVLDVLKPFRLLDAALDLARPATIDLEDEDAKWLLEKVKAQAARIYGIFAEVYVQALEDVEKKGDLVEEPTNGSKPRLAKAGK